MFDHTTLRTAEINNAPCVLFYPTPVHMSVSTAVGNRALTLMLATEPRRHPKRAGVYEFDEPINMRVIEGFVSRPSPILYEPMSAKLQNAIRLARQRELRKAA